MNSKSVFILVILVFFSVVFYAQKKSKEITILYFSRLSDKDIADIENIKNVLWGKRESKKNRYNIKLTNFYTNEKVDLNRIRDFKYSLSNISANINNLTYTSTNLVIEKIQKLNLPNLFSFKSNASTDIEFGLVCTDVKQVSKLIKKSNESTINIIWDNGFVPYLYSAKNIKTIYEQCVESNEISKLIPKIIHPFFKEQLLPDESGYIIEFDSVGCFPEYEIEINSTSERNKGQFVKEHLKFSQIEELGKDIFMYYAGEGKLCKIYISQTYLGKICKKMEHTDFDTGQLPTEEDCPICLNTCLYPTRFELRIRGYVTGYSKDDLWSDFVKRFSFQCPSHN